MNKRKRQMYSLLFKQLESLNKIVFKNNRNVGIKRKITFHIENTSRSIFAQRLSKQV